MNEDQFRQTYKKAVDLMKPSESMKQDLLNATNQRQERKRPRKTAYIAAGLLLAAGLGLASPYIAEQLNGGPASPGQMALAEPTQQPAAPAASSGAAVSGGVVIPKVKLPDSQTGAMSNMVALVVYQGNIYLRSSVRIDAANAAALRGDKLGTSKAGIDEWSSKEDYSELASNIGVADIYSVKGYDADFLIMSYTEVDGVAYADLYEHTNGITVNSGADLFGKLHLEGRVASAQWQSFNSWNNGLEQYAPLTSAEALDGFIAALQTAKPLAEAPLIEQGIYDSEDRRVIYLQLADQTKVELVLFGQGLVHYGSAPVFFEVEPGAFQALWNSMNP